MLESIFSFFKKNPLLFKDTIMASMFISNLGEKTEYGENRGCQIDKRKVIAEVASEFYTIKMVCLKYLDYYISNVGPEEKQMIVDYKLPLLKVCQDFITSTLNLTLMTSVAALYEKVQDILDDPLERGSMDTYMSAVLDQKHHELVYYDNMRHPNLSRSRRNSRRNSRISLPSGVSPKNNGSQAITDSNKEEVITPRSAMMSDMRNDSGADDPQLAEYDMNANTNLLQEILAVGTCYM
jgi:hypothetical protein